MLGEVGVHSIGTASEDGAMDVCFHVCFLGASFWKGVGLAQDGHGVSR